MTATPLHLPQQDVVKGSLYMAAAMAAFVSNDTLVKLLASELPVGTLVFIRGAFASFVLLAATAASGNLQKLPLIFSRDVTLRAGTDVISTLLFITALVHMPIGNLTAIVQAAPLLVTALAAMFLKERVGWRRTAAIIAGFTGVVLITKPTGGSFGGYSLLPVIVIASVAVRDIITRRIPVTVPVLIVALANSLMVVAGAFVLAIFEGGLAMPSIGQALILGAAGVFLSLGYLFMVNTLRYTDISASASIRFSVVPWGLLSGFLVFGERPDWLAMAGIVLIVGSGIYTLHREAKLKRLRKAHPDT